MNDLEDILAAALRLPTAARAAVVVELIDSLEQPGNPSEDVEAAWAEEIQQRLTDIDSGIATPIPWPAARRRIYAAANGRREAG